MYRCIVTDTIFIFRHRLLSLFIFSIVLEYFDGTHETDKCYWLLFVVLESTFYMHLILIDSILCLIQSIQYGGCHLHSVFAITKGNRDSLFLFFCQKQTCFKQVKEIEKVIQFAPSRFDVSLL